MTPEEAIDATRKMDGRVDATYSYMTTSHNGRIYIKAFYPNAKHIGQEDSTYIWDSVTGKLVRQNGGK